MEDSYENKVWEFYHEQTRDPILAYAVEIKGVEGDTVRGNLIELDYAAHVERMQKLTVPVETVAVSFKDDATFYLPFRSYRREAIPLEEKHGKVVSVSYLPENATELDMILRREPSRKPIPKRLSALPRTATSRFTVKMRRRQRPRSAQSS